MFKITLIHRFARTVEVLIPSEDRPDQVEKQTFTATFLLLDPDQQSAFQAAMAAAKDAAEVLRQEIEQIVAVTRGWSDVVAADGSPVEFGEAALRAACMLPWFRRAIAAAYTAGVAGEARLGN